MTTKKTGGRKSPASVPAKATLGPDIPLPGTSLQHPPIGLGLWALGRWNHEDEARTRATVERALDRGIRWFDTAEVYGSGRSERLLGDAVAARGARASDVFITSKLSVEHLRPSQVRPALLGSLRRLGLPKIDLYLVHGPDPHVPLVETMKALEALWKEGHVGALGVSNFSAEEVEEAKSALSEAPLVVNQVKANLLEPEELDALEAPSRAAQVLLEAYTPLARGLLAGRYLDQEIPDAQVRTFARDLFDRDRFPEYRERARALKALAETAGVPIASLALHGLARRGAAPVVGASRPEQVDALVEAWGRRPTDSVLREADRIARGPDA